MDQVYRIEFDNLPNMVDQQIADYLKGRYPISLNSPPTRNVLRPFLVWLLTWFTYHTKAVYLAGGYSIKLTDTHLVLRSSNWKLDEEIVVDRFEDLPISIDKIIDRLDREMLRRVLARKNALRVIGKEYRRIAGPAQRGDVSIAPPVGGQLMLMGPTETTVTPTVTVEPTYEDLLEMLMKAKYPTCKKTCDGGAACDCLLNDPSTEVFTSAKGIPVSTCSRYQQCLEEPGFCNCILER